MKIFTLILCLVLICFQIVIAQKPITPDSILAQKQTRYLQKRNGNYTGGILLFGSGLTLMTVGSLSKLKTGLDFSPGPHNSKSKGSGLIYIGGGVTLASVYFFIVGGKNNKKARDIRTEISKSFALDTSFVVSITTKIDSSRYALLYVYRPAQYSNWMRSYKIYLNDSIVGKLKNNSQFIVKVYREGPAKIWANTEKKSAQEFNIRFGKDYFLECSTTSTIGLLSRPEFLLVKPEQGLIDFKNIDEKKKRLPDY